MVCENIYLTASHDNIGYSVESLIAPHNEETLQRIYELVFLGSDSSVRFFITNTVMLPPSPSPVAAQTPHNATVNKLLK